MGNGDELGAPGTSYPCFTKDDIMTEFNNLSSEDDLHSQKILRTELVLVVNTNEQSPPNYQYGWWIMSEKYGDYRAEGVRGQFIYVNPAKKIFIVCLGKDRGEC